MTWRQAFLDLFVGRVVGIWHFQGGVLEEQLEEEQDELEKQKEEVEELKEL